MELKELLKRLTDCGITVKIEMDHSMIEVQIILKPNTFMDRPAMHAYYETDLDSLVKLNLSYEECLYQILLHRVREIKDYCERNHYRYESEMLKEIIEE